MRGRRRGPAAARERATALVEEPRAERFESPAPPSTLALPPTPRTRRRAPAEKAAGHALSPFRSSKQRAGRARGARRSRETRGSRDVDHAEVAVDQAEDRTDRASERVLYRQFVRRAAASAAQHLARAVAAVGDRGSITVASGLAASTPSAMARAASSRSGCPSRRSARAGTSATLLVDAARKEAAVDGDGLTVDEARRVAGEEDGRAYELLASLPKRRIGVRSKSSLPRSVPSSNAWFSSVRNTPGAMAFTVHASRPPLERQRFRESDDRGLAGTVRRHLVESPRRR